MEPLCCPKGPDAAGSLLYTYCLVGILTCRILLDDAVWAADEGGFCWPDDIVGTSSLILLMMLFADIVCAAPLP